MAPPTPSIQDDRRTPRDLSSSSSFIFLSHFLILVLLLPLNSIAESRKVSPIRTWSVESIAGYQTQVVDKHVDVCTKNDKEKEYFEAFYLDLLYRSKDDLLGPSKQRFCQYPVKRIAFRDDVWIELSFAENSKKNDVKECFTVEGKGFSNIEPDCLVEGSDKVFFRQKSEGESVTVTMTEKNLNEQLGVQLMVEHLPDGPVEETLNVIGDLRLKCDHPNPHLKPYLFKNNLDLTSELEPPELRTYSAKFDLEASNQGRYACSWDEERTERSVIIVNVFSPKIECKLELDGKEKGDYLNLARDSRDLLGNLEFSCSLPKATTTDAAKRIKLGWSDSDGVVIKDARTDSRDDISTASFSRDIETKFLRNNTLKDISFTCSLDHTDTSIDFQSGEPQACSIKIIVNDKGSVEALASTTLIIIIVVIVVVILVIIVVFIVCYRRNKRRYDARGGDHVSNHSSISDYQAKYVADDDDEDDDDDELEKKVNEKPGILKKSSPSVSKKQSGQQREKEKRRPKRRDVPKESEKRRRRDNDDDKDEAYDDDNDNRNEERQRKPVLAVDEGLSWDPSGADLTPAPSSPFKNELASALASRQRHEQDDDAAAISTQPPGAESKSSFLGLEYEDVVFPDDAVDDVGRTTVAPKKSPSANVRPETKAPGVDIVYSAVDKKKKQASNDERKRGNTTTSV